MPKIGAHVSAAVSLELSFQKAQSIGAECTQIFISPPQQWMQTKHDDEEIERFKKAAGESGIGPNFIHGTYLVNLGTDKPEHLQKSIDWLIWAMGMAQKLGIEGVIFHTGSHKGAGFEASIQQVVGALKKVLNQTSASEGVTGAGVPRRLPAASETSEDIGRGWRPAGPRASKPYLILENSAGAGGSIGGTFHELGQILKAVKGNTSTSLSADRLKICLDTCHVFASGYDIRTPITLKDALEEFDQEIGLENLAAIHANDSKFDLKMGKDRHENIGEGFIGSEGFEGLINHPRLKNVPFILEVPGFAGTGPDKENIKLLKGLRH